MAKKSMARAAKKSARIVSLATATMAAVATATVIDMNRMAYEQAMADMADEYGHGEDDMCQIAYMDPFDGLIA